MPILYGSLLSPFVRKVHITLEMKKLPYAVEGLIPFLAADKEKLLQLSPVGKIPIYQDDVITLADSSVICGYLDKQYPEVPLYPGSAAEYAQSLWYEEYADTELTSAIAKIFFHTLVAPKLGLPSDITIASTLLEVNLPQIFEYLNQEIASRQFLVGDQLSIADISVVGSLMTFILSGYMIDQKRWEYLARYYLQHVTSIPIFQQVYLQLKDLFKIKLAVG